MTPSRAPTLRGAPPRRPRGALAALLALALACAGAQRPAAPAAVEPAPSAEAAAITGLPTDAPVTLTAGKDAFRRGVELEAAGDLAGAAAAFEQAFQADPAAAVAGANAGLLRERLGDDAAARALYLRVLDRTFNFFPAAQDLVRLDARRGHAAEAEAELSARLAQHPDSVALHNGVAEAALIQGKLDLAEGAARRALKVDEKNVPAMVTLATVYARKKKFELAKMVLDNARQLDDRDATVWNRLGFVQLGLGDRLAALECFRTAAGLRPDYPEAHVNYGGLLADAEDFAGAVKELELAVKYGPANAVAWMNLGNAYRGLKEFEKAEDAYRRALSLDPKLVDVHYDLAVLYLDGDKPGTPALARLEAAVGFFDAYEKAGGKDPRLPAYRKDADRAIDREKKRLAREEKDRLRKEAEAKKKAEEEQKAEAAAAAGGGETVPAAAEEKAAPAPAPAPAPEGAPPKKQAHKKQGKRAAPTATEGAERGDK